MSHIVIDDVVITHRAVIRIRLHTYGYVLVGMICIYLYVRLDQFTVNREIYWSQCADSQYSRLHIYI